jgi:Protein of unknown function (DUF2806)
MAKRASRSSGSASQIREDELGGEVALRLHLDGSGLTVAGQSRFLSATDRLLGGIVGIPAAYLEGIRARLEENNSMRLQGLRARAEEIAKLLQDTDPLCRSTVRRLITREIKNQINLEAVWADMFESLRSSPRGRPTEDTNREDPEELEEEWMDFFGSYAEKASSPHMRRLFGRILAGEIRRPASYSRKTIAMAALLDNDAAILFRRLCTLAISLRDAQGRVEHACVLAVESDRLRKYGLGFAKLNILREYELIISDIDSFRTYDDAVFHDGKVASPLTYQNRKWTLHPTTASWTPEQLKFHGVRFSLFGNQLLPLVEIEPTDMEPIEQYTDDLRHLLLERAGMSMRLMKPPNL